MSKKSHPATTSDTAFDCPHCNVFTTQHWFNVYAEPVDQEDRVPWILDETSREAFESAPQFSAENEIRFSNFIDKMSTGEPFFEMTEPSKNLNREVKNIFLSKCYNCGKMAAWVHQTLLFPQSRVGAEPNQDLPEEIIQDIEEARTIVDFSPRGAAALLRLSIQKLCSFLGETGENIDKDIASLVVKGLSPRVQKCLDVVRVIGNEAVHPGVLDLKDDRDTAFRLLDLVNIITEQMISQPKMIDEMYEKLPEGKRTAIETRNEKALKRLGTTS